MACRLQVRGYTCWCTAAEPSNQQIFICLPSQQLLDLLGMRTLLWWGQLAQAVAVAEVEAVLRVANMVSH